MTKNPQTSLFKMSFFQGFEKESIDCPISELIRQFAMRCVSNHSQPNDSK